MLFTVRFSAQKKRGCWRVFSLRELWFLTAFWGKVEELKWSSSRSKTRLFLPVQIAYLTYRESQCKFSISHAKPSLIDSSRLRVANQYYQVAVALCRLLWFHGKPHRSLTSGKVINRGLDYESNEYSLVKIKNTNIYSPFNYKPFLQDKEICNFNLQVLQLQYWVTKYNLKGKSVP